MYVTPLHVRCAVWLGTVRRGPLRMTDVEYHNLPLAAISAAHRSTANPAFILQLF